MNDSDFSMVIISAILVCILLITYIPSALLLREKNIHPFSMKGFKVLGGIFFALILLSMLEDLLGLGNPLGLILVNAIIVSYLSRYSV